MLNWLSDFGQVSAPIRASVSPGQITSESSEALFVSLIGLSLWAGLDDHPEELGLPMHAPGRTTSRASSSSSDSSTNLHSPNPSDDGADTPLAQSDDEEDGGDGGAESGACS